MMNINHNTVDDPTSRKKQNRHKKKLSLQEKRYLKQQEQIRLNETLFLLESKRESFRFASWVATCCTQLDNQEETKNRASYEQTNRYEEDEATSTDDDDSCDESTTSSS